MGKKGLLTLRSSWMGCGRTETGPACAERVDLLTCVDFLLGAGGRLWVPVPSIHPAD